MFYGILVKGTTSARVKFYGVGDKSIFGDTENLAVGGDVHDGDNDAVFRCVFLRDFLEVLFGGNGTGDVEVKVKDFGGFRVTGHSGDTIDDESASESVLLCHSLHRI